MNGSCFAVVALRVCFLFVTGNILVDGTYPNLKLNILDCGLVLEMGPDQHVNLVKVLGAFTRRDGRLAGQLMVDLKSETQATPYDVEMFIRGIEQICFKDDEQVCTNVLHLLRMNRLDNLLSDSVLF